MELRDLDKIKNKISSNSLCFFGFIENDIDPINIIQYTKVTTGQVVTEGKTPTILMRFKHVIEL